MPTVPTYEARLFNAPTPQTVHLAAPPDWSGIMQTGSELIAQGQKQQEQEGEEKGYADQMASKDGNLVQKPLEWDRGYGDAGYNKSAQLAFGMQKERQLRQTMQSLGSQYRTDPTGFQKAATQAQSDFFKNVPLKVQPGLQDMWNRSNDAVLGDIQDKIVQQKKAQDQATVLTGLDRNVTRLENQVLQDGHNPMVGGDIIHFQGQTAAAVNAGMLTPLQANDMNQNAAIRLSKAYYINQVNNGADADQLTHQILDPNGPMRDFDISKRQAIVAEVHSAKNLNLQAHAADRSTFETKWNAQVSLAKEGLAQDIDVAASQMIMKTLGYDQPTIDKTITQYQEAQHVGGLVNVLKSGPLQAGTRMVQAARSASDNYSGSDPVQHQNLYETYQALAEAQTAKRKAYQDDPWAAQATYAPSAASKYSTDTDDGLNAARADLISKTGNANIPVLPQTVLQAYKDTLSASTDPTTTVNVLADLRNRYPSNFSRISDALKLTPGEQAAAELVNQRKPQEAQTIIIAEKDAKKLETFAKTEDVNTAYDGAFDKTQFSTPLQAANAKANFTNLFRYYKSLNLSDDAASQKAQQTIMSGYKRAILNGTDTYVTTDTDTDKINRTLDNLAASPMGHNLSLGARGAPVLNSEMKGALSDPTRTQLIPQDGGYAILDLTTNNPYYQTTPTGKQLLIIGRDGSLRGNDPRFNPQPSANHQSRGVWDGGAIGVTQWDQPPSPTGVIQGQNAITVPTPAGKAVGFKPGTETEAPLDTVSRAYGVMQREGLAKDPVAARLTKDPEQQKYLNGVSAIIRSGTAPDFALEALSQSGVSEFKALKVQGVRDQVAAKYADPSQRGLVVGGMQETPLQSIDRLTREAISDSAKRYGGNGTAFKDVTSALIGKNSEEDSGKTSAKTSGDDDQSTSSGVAFDKFAATMRERESSNDYGRSSPSGGFIGAYQMGPQALADAGLLNPSALKGNRSNAEILNDPDRWTLPGGKKAFLKNKELQDRVFRAYTNRNYRSLRSRGVLTENRSPADVAGNLAVAHLLGVGGAQDYANGINGQDGNGTAASEYFQLGLATTQGDQN